VQTEYLPDGRDYCPFSASLCAATWHGLLALRSPSAKGLLLTPPCAAPVTLSSGAQGCSELAPFCDVSPTLAT